MKAVFTSKSDLAQAYFPYIEPNSARNKLMTLINEDGELRGRLEAAGYRPLCHTFSPVQVEIIMERLGNPFGLTPNLSRREGAGVR